MRSTIALLSVSLGCAGFASVGCAHRPPAPAPVAQSFSASNPMIVRLVGRRYTVNVTAGPKAPLYTITDLSGKVLADNMTLAQLRVSDQSLYEEIVPALAPEARADLGVDRPFLYDGKDE
jgi:hypothetical protein